MNGFFNCNVFRVGLICLYCSLAISAQISSRDEVEREAEPTSTRTAYKSSRQDEEWSFLKDKSRRRDYADRLKYIPLGKKDWYLSIGGEARPFYEFFRNEDWGSEPRDGNGWLLERYMLHGDFHFGRKFRVFAQIKSGLINNRVGGVRGSDLDKLDFHQLFFDYNFKTEKDKTVFLRVGRQELSFGSGRRVALRDARNVRRSFDAVRLSAEIAEWSFDAFAAKPVSVAEGFFDDRGLQETFTGIYAVSPSGFLTKKGKIDFYYFGLDRKTAKFNQGIERERRHTFGTRIWRAGGALDYNFEFGYQFGKFGRGNISAWEAASDTGYTVKKWFFKPRFGIKADRSSGDKNPLEPNLQTFNGLFPKSTYYGRLAPVGPYNLTDLHPSVLLNVNSKFSVSIDALTYWRTSRSDGIYSVPGALLRGGNHSRARHIGWQYAVEGDYNLDRHTTLSAYYGRFNAGKFLRETPPAKNTDYFAAWITYLF